MPDNPTLTIPSASTDTTTNQTPTPVPVAAQGGPVPRTPEQPVAGPEVHTDTATPEPPTKDAPPTWWAELPKELQSEKSLESFKGAKSEEALAKIAKSYVEAQKLIGGKVSIPTEKDAPEVHAAFWKKAGAIPDKAEDYKLQKPIFPGGMEMTDAELTAFASRVHAKNIPPAMAQEILNYYGDVVKAAVPDYQKLANDCLFTLREGTEQTDKTRAGGWGPATERNLGVAKRALFTVFGKETATKVEQTALGSDPDFVRGMYQVGKMMVEEGSLPPEVAQGLQGDNAKGELDKIYTDSKHPYWHKNAPGHDAAVDHVRNLELMSTAY